MKTAVEFLVEEFSEILGKVKTQPMEDLLLVDAIKQAKEMEKQQIIDAHCDGQSIEDTSGVSDAEQYYNETFKL